jgi:site-specific recombinase XerD
MATIKGFIYKDKVRLDGFCQIFVSISYAGGKYRIPTVYRVQPDKFEQTPGLCKKTAKDSYIINAYLVNMAAQITAKITEQELKHGIKKANIKDIIAKLLAGDDGASSNDFFEWCRKYINNKPLISKSTKKSYLFTVDNYLQPFDAELSFAGINTHLVGKFAEYMQQRGITANGVALHLRNFRVFCRAAKRDGLLNNAPFDNFKIVNEDTDKGYLTETELDTVYALWEAERLSDKLQNTLKHYLRACFTGLRMGDIRALTHENFKDGFLCIEMEKTRQKKKTVKIPLSKKALKLMPTDFDFMGEQSLKLSKSRITGDLREIFKIAGINKELSFHSSRHTFAVVCLQKGIPVEVVQSILGHSDIKTTQIYAKVIDTLKVDEMAKWDL